MTTHASTMLLGAGGICWLAGQAVLPDLGLTTAERYDAVLSSPTEQAWSTALLVAAGCLLVLGSLSAARATSALAGPGARLVRAGLSMLALGGIWLAAGRAAFNMVFLRVTSDAVPREVALGILDDGGGAEFVPLLLTLPCLLLGPVLLAVGLRRAGAIGWFPLVAWSVGIVTFVVTEFTVKVGEVAGIAFAALALVMIGRGAEQASRAGQDGADAGASGTHLAVP